ncbi:organic cation transporter protein-like isoform X2 [Hermetia illucens]|uniref:organic cation transporter protein-like isoform X2 n=1 Tax=Hermetia illucens TaxID=343691 RepID=UPI0018CC1349|nr:organic cation transporter protein-like isoform X2 [Hermetia illucens]
MEKHEHEQRLLDPVQNAMGQLGIWHIWTCAVIFLLKFPVAWHQMAIIFLSPPMDFKCAQPPDVDKCSRDCKQYEYNRSVFTETIVTQWNLVCDEAYLANLSQTLFMLGILVGNILFGIWADKLGRRNPLVAAVIIQLISGVITAFAPWYWLFLILKFITAMATGGTMCTSFVIVMEIIGPKWREVFSVVYQIPFNMGHLLLPLFAYFIRDWRYFQFAISIPSVILISYYWLVPESPRWLFTTGKIDEAAVILEKAAKQNKLPTDHIRSDLEEASKRNASEGKTSKGDMTDLFKTLNMFKKTVIMIFNWFVCGLAFFGVAQYMGQIGGNIFANVAVGAALELPGTLVCIFMMKHLGRKITLISSNTLTGISMLCIAFVSKDTKWAIVALSSAGIVGMSISFPTVYLYGAELFPTVVRNGGIGICSVSARVGSMIAPFVAGLSYSYHTLPAIIFGLTPLVGAALVFLLPETKGQPLPETIQDGETFGKKDKKISTVEAG